MSRTVFCLKLQQEAEGLDFPPYPGEVGKQIYQTISKEAWQNWLGRQTMFINEYRLDLTEPQARAFLLEEMKKFLFEGSDQPPAGYQPEE